MAGNVTTGKRRVAKQRRLFLVGLVVLLAIQLFQYSTLSSLLVSFTDNKDEERVIANPTDVSYWTTRGSSTSEDDCMPPLVWLPDLLPSIKNATKRLIPRFIHLSMKSRCLHPAFMETAMAWHEAYPYDTVFFHDDEAVDRFVLENDWPEFPLLKQVYNHCLIIGGAIKVDIWRLLIVYKYGGLYSDIDRRPGPLMREGTGLLETDQAFFLADAWRRTSQWAFAMVPGHPILRKAVNLVLHKLMGLKDVNALKPVFVTGPHTLFLAVREVFNNYSAEELQGGGVFHQGDLELRKIPFRQVGQYVTNIDFGQVAELNGKNMTLRARIKEESGVIHWQQHLGSAQRARKVRGPCGSLINVTITNYLAYLEEERLDAMNVSDNNGEKSDKRLAFDHSYGLFDNILNTEWEKIRTVTKQRSWYDNPQNPLDRIDDAKWWNANNMNPNFDCPVSSDRVGGTDKEGTKFMCSPMRVDHRGDCLIYSVGSAGNFKWEDAISQLYNKRCEIHVFDPASAWERPGDKENKNIHYHAWGIVSSYDNMSKSVVWPKGRGGGFKTFQETLKELGHQHRIMDILKIDCEGCEWSSIKDWIQHGIRQILVEVHGVPTPQGTPKARWYQRPMDVTTEYWNYFSDNGYALFSRDPNGDLGLELSFIKLHENFWEG